MHIERVSKGVKKSELEIAQGCWSWPKPHAPLTKISRIHMSAYFLIDKGRRAIWKSTLAIDRPGRRGIRAIEAARNDGFPGNVGPVTLHS